MNLITPLHDNPKRDIEVRRVVRNAYIVLTAMSLVASVGVCCQITLHLNPAIFALSGIFSLLVYFGLKFSGSSQKLKVATVLLFSFCEGISIAPLVNLVIAIDPNILYLAIFGTIVIFLCFTIAAFVGQDNFLFIGGSLGSLLFLFCFLGVANLFLRLEWISVLEIYGGLIMFTFFILYDTQKMIALAKAGETDYCDFAIDLFLDALGIFIRLLIILARKGKSDDRKSGGSLFGENEL